MRKTGHGEREGIDVLDLSLFDATYDGRAFEAGDVIFRAGDPADCLYVVLSGEIEVVVNGESRGIVGERDVVGELAVIDGGERTGTATAVTDVVVVPMGRLRLEYLISKHPAFALDLLATVVERLRSERSGLHS